MTEPSYQNPPGTLYYPPSTQDSRQSIVYPTYGPNLNIPMIPSYHQELTQQQVQSQALASEQVKQKQTKKEFQALEMKFEIIEIYFECVCLYY